MKMLMLSLCASVAFACGGGSKAKGEPFLEPIMYAVNHLGLEDNGDIGVAISSYKKILRSQEYKIPTEAFGGTNFNAGVYALHSSDAKKLDAQIDLIDTLYLIFNDEQKKKFPVLLGIYQHHSDFSRGKNSCDTTKSACGFNANSCGTKNAKNSCNSKSNSCDSKKPAKQNSNKKEKK